MVPILYIYHALGIGIAFIGWMRRSIMDHGLVNGVCCLVREDAS